MHINPLKDRNLSLNSDVDQNIEEAILFPQILRLTICIHNTYWKRTLLLKLQEKLESLRTNCF